MPIDAAYLIDRWYDGGTGEFMSLDPLVQSTLQPYQYVGNDPLNGTDPSGLKESAAEEAAAAANLAQLIGVANEEAAAALAAYTAAAAAGDPNVDITTDGGTTAQPITVQSSNAQVDAVAEEAGDAVLAPSQAAQDVTTTGTTLPPQSAKSSSPDAATKSNSTLTTTPSGPPNAEESMLGSDSSGQGFLNSVSDAINDVSQVFTCVPSDWEILDGGTNAAAGVGLGWRIVDVSEGVAGGWASATMVTVLGVSEGILEAAHGISEGHSGC
jgi:hypothetical protein